MSAALSRAALLFRMTQRLNSKQLAPTALRWLREATVIVASVLLGFCAAEFGDEKRDRELRTRVLRGIAAEVAANEAGIAAVVDRHRQWVAALDTSRHFAEAQSAIDVFFATRPPMPDGVRSPFPILSRSAWDAAVSSGAMRLIDYDLSAALSDIYRMQETATQNVERLANGALSAVSTYDPKLRPQAVRLLWLTLADIHAAEAVLLDMYRRHLPAIRAAAPDAS